MISKTMRTALALAVLAAAAQALAKRGPSKEKLMADVKQGKDLYATFDTSMGTIVCKLFSKDAPKTVENFVGLATGAKVWRDPKSGQEMKGKPLYDGTIFHRVIPNFMIQGGDPLGTGTGTPGYRFADEIHPDDAFSRPGLLAMANAGPDTNGSQFFITEVATPHLNGHHTIFGEVVCGLGLVGRIARAGSGATRLVHVAISSTPPTCR